MSLHELEKVNGSVAESINSSYSLVGRPLINGSLYFQVSLNESIISPQETGTFPATIWFLPNGTATEMFVNGIKYAGATASLEGELLLASFVVILEGPNMLNQTGITPSSYSILNESSVMLGTTLVNQTDYQFSAAYLNNESACSNSSTEYTELLLGIGRVPGLNFDIAILTYEAYSQSGSTYVDEIQVTSVATS